MHAAQIFMNEIERVMAGSVMTGPVCIIVFDFYNSSLSGGNACRSPTLCLSASTRLVAASEEEEQGVESVCTKNNSMCDYTGAGVSAGRLIG